MKNDILNGFYDVEYKGTNDFRSTKANVAEAWLYGSGDLSLIHISLFPAICCSFVMKWVFWQRIRLLFMRWDRKSRLCRIFLIAGKSFSSL